MLARFLLFLTASGNSDSVVNGDDPVPVALLTMPCRLVSPSELFSTIVAYSRLLKRVCGLCRGFHLANGSEGGAVARTLLNRSARTGGGSRSQVDRLAIFDMRSVEVHARDHAGFEILMTRDCRPDRFEIHVLSSPLRKIDSRWTRRSEPLRCRTNS